jgi:hypothetical protein
MDNVQKHNNGINIPSSQSCRSLLYKFIWDNPMPGMMKDICFPLCSLLPSSCSFINVLPEFLIFTSWYIFSVALVLYTFSARLLQAIDKHNGI